MCAASPPIGWPSQLGSQTNILTRSLVNVLSAQSVTLSDIDGNLYEFRSYSVRSVPNGQFAVYAFASLGLMGPHPKYIGKAKDLTDRLRGHERLAEAIRIGATHLLVHHGGLLSALTYEDVEQRLIARYTPPLNQQFNPLSHR